MRFQPFNFLLLRNISLICVYEVSNHGQDSQNMSNVANCQKNISQPEKQRKLASLSRVASFIFGIQPAFSRSRGLRLGQRKTSLATTLTHHTRNTREEPGTCSLRDEFENDVVVIFFFLNNSINLHVSITSIPFLVLSLKSLSKRWQSNTVVRQACICNKECLRTCSGENEIDQVQGTMARYCRGYSNSIQRMILNVFNC